MMGLRAWGVAWAVTAPWVLAACEQGPPDLPLNDAQVEDFHRRVSRKLRKDVVADVTQAAPPRASRYAVSVNVGDIKVIEGDSTNVSSVTTQNGQSGFGLRMDRNRQDLPRITSQVIQEEGDHFDFIVVFPTFDDLYNPGFAYFSPIRITETGIGQSTFDQSEGFGSNGRLQGFLNMNSPGAYTRVDGKQISDETSAVYPIMGQEATHRWLAFALFRKPGFQDGQVSNLLLGRDDAHWSVLMHTGPADLSQGIYSSVQDGVAWRDNGNGTFTAVDVFSDTQFNISERARFSTLDLYLMGLRGPQEVEPWFIINNARFGQQVVQPTSVVTRNITISGEREDITIDHVIGAMGPRTPSVADSQKDFNMAIVVLTQPGQTAADVMNTVAQVEAFRARWETLWSDWTGGRSTMCTALSGDCATSRLALSPVTITETDGSAGILPGETVRASVTVTNNGSAMSVPSSVTLAAEGASITNATRMLGALGPDASTTLEFDVAVGSAFACGTRLELSATLTVENLPPTVVTGTAEVGVRQVLQDRMESSDGWVVNPGMMDTATAGRWSRGVPRRTDLRRFGVQQVVIQADGDSTDTGTNAWFTDPGTNALTVNDIGATDTDDGTTTLESPAYDISGLRDPVLRLATFHTGIVVDTEAGELRPGTEDDLVIRIRAGGGAWVELDRDASNEFTWLQKEFRLRDVAGLSLDGATSIQLRLEVGDVGPEQNLVEAGVDDIRITDLAAECPSTGTGSSSSSGGGASSSGGATSSSSGGATGASSSGGAGSPGDGEGEGGGVQPGNCACTIPDTAPGRGGATLAGVVLFLALRRARRGSPRA